MYGPGKAGAEAIKAAVGDSLKTRGINVLTHCNTGSLATAGYGIFPSVSLIAHALLWEKMLCGLVSEQLSVAANFTRDGSGLHTSIERNESIASCILYGDETVQPRIPANCV